MSIHKVDHKGLYQMLERYWVAKVPIYIWGGTGIGKSQTVREFAQKKAEGLHLEFKEGKSGEKVFGFYDIRLSTLDPTDLRGVPFLKNADGKNKTAWALPELLPELGQGVIFLDEINLATPSMQAGAYQLIRDRKIGEYEVPEGYMIIAAGNRLEDKAHTFELPTPLANRFTHVELMTPEDDIKMVDSWCNWSGENDVDARIITFINYQKSMLYKIARNEKAFPTPRAWAEYCSPLIKGLSSDEIGPYVKSSVGEGAGAQLQAFIKLSEKLDLNKLLDNPESIKKVVELDQKWSLVGAFAEMYKTKPGKELAVRVMKVITLMEPEFGILFLKAVAKTRIFAIKEINQYIARFTDYIV